MNNDCVVPDSWCLECSQQPTTMQSEWSLMEGALPWWGAEKVSNAIYLCFRVCVAVKGRIAEVVKVRMASWSLASRNNGRSKSHQEIEIIPLQGCRWDTGQNEQNCQVETQARGQACSYPRHQSCIDLYKSAFAICLPIGQVPFGQRLCTVVLDLGRTWGDKKVYDYGRPNHVQ